MKSQLGKVRPSILEVREQLMGQFYLCINSIWRKKQVSPLTICFKEQNFCGEAYAMIGMAYAQKRGSGDVICE